MKTILPLLLALLLLSSSAGATENCLIGTYANAEGTWTLVAPAQFVPFDVYVVWRDEFSIEGASYRIIFPPDVSVIGRFIGPDGAGFEFINGEGGPSTFDTIAAFGDCSLGFGAQEVVVARYQAVVTAPNIYNEQVLLEPNPGENPASIEYASCSNTIETCPNVQTLLFDIGFPIENQSFAAVKSLYYAGESH